MYNVTMRRFRENNVWVEKKQVSRIQSERL